MICAHVHCGESTPSKARRSPDAATSILASALFEQAMAREQARDDRDTGVDLVGLGLLASLVFR